MFYLLNVRFTKISTKVKFSLLSYMSEGLRESETSTTVPNYPSNNRDDNFQYSSVERIIITDKKLERWPGKTRFL